MQADLGFRRAYEMMVVKPQKQTARMQLPIQVDSIKSYTM
jgi:hypothetical protein